jgi:hypothetical protein
MEDAYVFRKSVRSAFGVDMTDDHLPYEALNTRLKKVGELTGFSIPVGSYCFRRANGEALDNSSQSSPSQFTIIEEANALNFQVKSVTPSAISAFSMLQTPPSSNATTYHAILL